MNEHSMTNRNLITSFSSPAKDQKPSNLLQLPTEIRLKILRNSLKQKGRICNYHEYQEKSKRRRRSHSDFVEEIFNLSAQIMQCCQQLYEEGRNVLYGENTLSISIVSQRAYSIRYPKIYIFDAALPIPKGSPRDLRDAWVFDEVDFARSVKWLGDASPKTLILSFSKSMYHFQNFKIVFS